MRLTRRGRLVRTVLILMALVIWINIVSNSWWVDGGYCLGSFYECFGVIDE